MVPVTMPIDVSVSVSVVGSVGRGTIQIPLSRYSVA